MTEIDPGAAYVRRPGLEAVEMDGDLVMMGLEQGEYFALRDVAATIWSELGEPRSVDDLCAAVARDYDVSAESCRPDVEQFLGELLTRRLATTAS